MAARIRNWKELDAAHRRRGELITVVFSPDGASAWQKPAYAQKTGKPRVYSDDLIEALLLAKVVLRLSLRAVEGFARGMARIAQASWPTPNQALLRGGDDASPQELDRCEPVGTHPGAPEGGSAPALQGAQRHQYVHLVRSCLRPSGAGAITPLNLLLQHRLIREHRKTPSFRAGI